ncbi:hypothetical protein SpCBS45565_g05711 [Spizellomyces sp. 'palustris']|nr:hypothetical protein SpCBS45565_g05711 [Spizellomyces sp. 'palustris']
MATPQLRSLNTCDSRNHARPQSLPPQIRETAPVSLFSPSTPLLSPIHPGGLEDSPDLQAVLDTLVQNTLSYSATSLPASDRLFFSTELRRLIEDSSIPLADKIDGATELADMCLGRGWESGTDIDIGEELDIDGIRASETGKSEDADASDKHAILYGVREGNPRKRTRLDEQQVTQPSVQLPIDGTTAAVVPKSVEKMPVSLAKDFPSGFLQHCPEDILLYIFSHLDARSLCRSSQSCRYWNALISSFETSVWSRLTRSRWGVGEPNQLGMSWKEYFQMHWNVQVGHFDLHRFKEQEAQAEEPAGTRRIEQGVTSPAEDGHDAQSPLLMDMIGSSHDRLSVPSNVRRRYVAAWPADPNNAYIVALDSDNAKLAWVDADDPISIRVSSINQDGSLSPHRTLDGHENPIGLILSNMEGTLVSFDDSSTIIVWNIRTMQFERAINANEELGFIFSMNIHKRRIVTGGKNGRVIVWDADTGDAIWTVDVEEKYLSGLSVQNLLNVAVWEDLVAYGVWEGGFWVGNMKEKRQIATFEVEDMRKAMTLRSGSGIVNEGTTSAYEETVHENPNNTASDSSLVLSDRVEQDEPSNDTAGPSSMAETPSYTSNDMPSSASLSQDGPSESEQAAHGVTTNGANVAVVVPPGVHGDLTIWFDSDSETDTEDDEEGPPGPPGLHGWIPPPFVFPAAAEPTLFPMTLALNGHLLLTNGPERHQLAVWDLRGLTPLYTLSSTQSDCTAPSLDDAQRQSSHARWRRRRDVRPPEIKFAEISRDGSMVFASVTDRSRRRRRQDLMPPEKRNEFLVWDFRKNINTEKPSQRKFEKVRIGGRGEGGLDWADGDDGEGIEIWICWDEEVIG